MRWSVRPRPIFSGSVGSKDNAGAPPRIAGALARAQGWPREAPAWLPAHTPEYRREWLKGWDEEERRKYDG